MWLGIESLLIQNWEYESQENQNEYIYNLNPSKVISVLSAQTCRKQCKENIIEFEK